MSTDFITFTLDQVVVRLRENYDFRFLKDIGEVFAVFDEQDSGNICFGVDNGHEKLFVKYAGARTIDFNGDPNDAVARLKKAVPLYDTLRHPSLIELQDDFPVNDGYAAVFTWFSGECLHSHWAFTPFEKYTHPDSPSCRHKHLSLDLRLDSMDTILAFHDHVALKGYVAIDFYDGSILYDFSHNITKICDIDFYNRQPYVNRMGRLWGSTRFMSPEEFEQGALIDEVTNVFNMGAAAFVLLGGETDRSFEKWEAGEALYEVARKAINPDRNERYSSILAFRYAWNEAKLKH
ncbi:MAG: serine/threonine protein kinase [Armatimonadota bacterium]